jgi:hypothetical protein
MPICTIKAPPGIGPIAKKKMMEEVCKAIEEGYQHIGDTFVILEEDQLDMVMMNGRMASGNPKYDEFRKKSA